MNARRLGLYALALSILGFVLGYEAGAARERDRGAAELARANADHAAEHEQASRQALTELQAAQARGDSLARALAAATDDSERMRKSRDEALRRVTTGRECLSADAVSVLNAGLAASDHKRLPEATSSAPAAVTAAPATDRDIAAWASDARARYAKCASRLNALIDFEETRE